MRRSSKLLWACLLVATIFLLALPAGVYFLSPYIAQKSLQYWLEQNQFSAIELDMHTPEWNQLHIKNIQLEKHSSAQIIRVKSQDINLQFNPYTLWHEQRLEQLTMPSSSIKITYLKEQTSDTSTEQIDLSQALPSSWFPLIPIDTIKIGEVTLTLDYPAEQSDWQFIGALLFADQQLYSRVKALRNQSDFGWGDLHLNQSNQFKFRLLEQDEPFFNIEGNLSFDKQLALSSTQQIQLDGLQRWRKKLQLHDLPIPALSGQIELQGQSYFPLKTRFSPDELLKSIQIDQVVKGQITAIEPIPELAKATLHLDGAVKFSLEKTELGLHPKTSLQLIGLKNPSLKAPLQELKINLLQALNLNLDIAKLVTEKTLVPEISALSLGINTSTLKLQGVQILPLRAELALTQMDLANSELSGSIAIPQLSVKQGKTTLPKLQLSSTFSLAKGQFKNRFKASTKSPLKLTLNGQSNTNLASGSSNLNWTLQPVNLKGIDRALEVFLPIPKELSMLKGSLFHKGSGWVKNGKFSARFNNSIRAVDLTWGETLIEGLNLDSNSRLNSNGRLSDTGTVKLNRVTSGIQATNLQTRYTYQQRSKGDLVTLKDTQLELFKGLISMSDFSFNPAKPEITTQVQVDKIDLGAVMALERQQGLSGEGKLGGSFPLTFKNNEFTITDGELKGLAPGGRILFEPTPAVQAYAAANIGLKMAIEALQNFHYEELDIGLNYLADGTALLKTRLKGKNPDWQNGHPVDFTINVEENIPSLIKTLQFADKLTKTIEKRYR